MQQETNPTDMLAISDAMMIGGEKFVNEQDFSQHIEKLAYENDTTILETLLDFAEDNDLEYSAIARMLSKSLKDKLQNEAEEACLLKKESQTLEL